MKIAVVGLGNMGKIHLRNYSEIKGVNIIGVSDIDSSLVKSLSGQYSTTGYLDYKSLIKNLKIDGVSVTVPTSLHLKVASAFIESKIPCLIEKPITSNSKDALKIIRLAKKHNVPVMVGHVERYNSAIVKLQELISNKKFGKILSIVVKRVGFTPPNNIDTNVVTDLAVHDLDILNKLIGKRPISVTARGSSVDEKNLEDNANIYLDYGSYGCFLETNWVTPVKIRTINITGEKLYCELNYITRSLKIYDRLSILKNTNDFSRYANYYGNPKYRYYYPKGNEPVKEELKDFISMIKNGNSPRVSPSDAYEALYLADLINRSIKYRKTIMVK